MLQSRNLTPTQRLLLRRLAAGETIVHRIGIAAPYILDRSKQPVRRNLVHALRSSGLIKTAGPRYNAGDIPDHLWVISEKGHEMLGPRPKEELKPRPGVFEYRGRRFTIRRHPSTRAIGMNDYRVVTLHENGTPVAEGIGATYSSATRAALYKLFPLQRHDRVTIAERSLAGFNQGGEVISTSGNSVTVRFDNGITSTSPHPGDYARDDMQHIMRKSSGSRRHSAL